LYYLLFTFYLAISCFFITRITFIKRSALAVKLILALFLLKIAAGVLIGWMSQKFYPQGSDYWGLNVAGWNDYHVLMSDPKAFFKDIFVSPYDHGYDRFFNSTESYWNNLKNTLIVKFLAFCNLFSRGNYYINSLFFNFIGFFGHIALYRIFADIFKNKKWPVIIGCFLLPSTLYFSSGIHKDLVVFTMLALYCYALYFSLRNGLTRKYLFTIIISFTVLLFIRNFVAVGIIPATIALILSEKLRWNSLLIFISTYSIAFLMLFLMQALRPSFQPLKIISQKQRDFFDLPYASSQLETTVLEPNLKSLIQNAPEALNHSILRPYLFGPGPSTQFLVPLAIELFFYQLLFVLMLIFYQRKSGQFHPFIFFGIFLTLSLLLFTGYIVPNTGSIVRYRSLYLPLIITPLLCYINWKKFGINILK